MKIFSGAKNDNWRTPDRFFHTVDGLFQFQWDLACTEEDKKCQNGITPDTDFLSLTRWEHPGNAWMNPPFSKAKDFIQKAINLDIPTVVLYKANNLDTGTWQDVILPWADWIYVLRGRINFVSPEPRDEKNGNYFGCALIGLNLEKHLFLDALLEGRYVTIDK